MQAKFIDLQELKKGNYKVSAKQKLYLEYLLSNKVESILEDTSGIFCIVAVGQNIYPVLVTKQLENLTSLLSLRVCFERAVKVLKKKVNLEDNSSSLFNNYIFNPFEKWLQKVLDHKSLTYMVEIDCWLYMGVTSNPSLPNDLDSITRLLSKNLRCVFVVRNIDLTVNDYDKKSYSRRWTMLPLKETYEHIPKNKLSYYKMREEKLTKYSKKYGLTSRKWKLNENNIDEFKNLTSLLNKKHDNIFISFSKSFLLFCSQHNIIQTDFITDKRDKIVGVRFDFLFNNTVYAQYPGFYKDIHGLFDLRKYTAIYSIPKNFYIFNWGGSGKSYKEKMAERKQTHVLIYTKYCTLSFRMLIALIKLCSKIIHFQNQ